MNTEHPRRLVTVLARKVGAHNIDLVEDAVQETLMTALNQSSLPSVYEVLYQLFNDGCLSAHAEFAMRRKLCDEKLRLATPRARTLRGSKWRRLPCSP